MYGVNSVEFGAWREARQRMDKYWVFGGLEKYVTCVGSYLTGSNQVQWQCDCHTVTWVSSI